MSGRCATVEGALLVGFLGINSAVGQVTTHTYNAQHAFVLTPSGAGAWSSVQIGYYLHAWVRYTPAAGGGGTAVFRPGGSPADPPSQPVGYAPFGYDDIWLSQPRNVCPWGLCNPPRTVTPSMKTVPIGPSGLPLTTVTASVPAVARADANASFQVGPWSAGSTVNGLIRSHGFWQEVPGAGAYSRAFSYTQARAVQTVPPPPPPGGPPVGLVRIAWTPTFSLVAAVRATPVAPSASTVQRVFDPITYTVTDLESGEQSSGTAFSMSASVLEGSVALEEGELTVDAQDAQFEVVVDDPRIEPPGSMRLRVQSGVIASYNATGMFDDGVDRAGLVAPFSIPVPATVLLTLRFDDVGIGPRRLELVMDGAGTSPGEGPPACGAADVGGQGGVAGADGNLDNNDFVVFINAFFDGLMFADRGTQGGEEGSDGLLDNNDFVVFIDQFFQGC